MKTQVFRVDPKKRERQHDHDRFAEIWLPDRGEAGDREANKDRRRCHKGTVAAKKSKRGREGTKQFHCGKTPAAGRRSFDSALAAHNPYIRTKVAGDRTWHVPM